MFLIVNYYKNKINVIIYAASIVSMMSSESQTAAPAKSSRWLSGFEETVKVLYKKSSFSENQVSQDPGGSVQFVILIIALGATLDQPFFTFLRLHRDQANYYRSVYACACFIDPVGYPCGIGGSQCN